MKNVVRALSTDPDSSVFVNDIVADLHSGDCLKLLRRLHDKSVHLLIGDLPFGITRCEWDRKLNLDRFWNEAERVLQPRGAVLMFGTQPFTSELVLSKRDWFKYEMIWRKNRPTGFQQCWQRPLSQHENVLVFSRGVIVGRHRSARQMTYNPQGLVALAKPRRRKGERRIGLWGNQTLKGAIQEWTNFPRSVLDYASVHKGVHPTQKPVDLLRYLIRTFSNPEDVVCDPTMGSGSTGVAAVLEHRNFVGIELDRRYFHISEVRIGQAALELARAAALADPENEVAAA